MLLYDVTYQSRYFDRDVTWDYLKSLAQNSSLEGAVARCTNGEPTILQLVNGEWVEVKPLQIGKTVAFLSEDGTVLSSEHGLYLAASSKKQRRGTIVYLKQDKVVVDCSGDIIEVPTTKLL